MTITIVTTITIMMTTRNLLYCITRQAPRQRWNLKCKTEDMYVAPGYHTLQRVVVDEYGAKLERWLVVQCWWNPAEFGLRNLPQPAVFSEKVVGWEYRRLNFTSWIYATHIVRNLYCKSKLTKWILLSQKLQNTVKQKSNHSQRENITWKISKESVHWNNTPN